MSGKKTLIIALIFGLAAGGFYFDQQRIVKKEEVKKTESRLIAQKGDELTGLTLTRGATAIRLVKEDKNWKLTEPIHARADREAVEGMLNQIDTAKKENVFTLDGGKLAEYGLDKPAVTVAFSNGKADKIPDLAVGVKTPDGGAAYARLGDRNEVFTLDKQLVTLLGSSPAQLRDKRTVPANVSQATTLTLSYDDKAFTLERKGNDWKLVSPVQGNADSNAVGTLLTEWGNAKASTFIDTPTLNLARFGLAKPYLTATAYVEGDDGLKNYTMLVGDVLTTMAANVGRNAMYKGEPVIYAIPDETAAKLRPSIDDLRTKDLFTTESADISRLQWKMLQHEMPLERGPDTKWRFSDDPKTLLDQNTLTQKLNSLVAMKAKRFFPPDLPASKTGLDQPNVVVVAWSKDGKTSQTLRTGRKADDGDFVYCQFVRSDGSVETVGVDWVQPGQLFLVRDDLLDKSIFRFASEQVHRAALQDATTSLSLVRTPTGAWEGTKVFDGKPGAKFSVEPVAMNSLLQAVAGLEWKRRLDRVRPLDLKDIESSGLMFPERWIRLYDASGKLLVELGQGASNDTTAFFSSSIGALYAIDKFRVAGYLDALKAVFTSAGSNLQLLDTGKVVSGSPEAQQLSIENLQKSMSVNQPPTTGTAALKEVLPAAAAEKTSATAPAKAPPKSAEKSAEK